MGPRRRPAGEALDLAVIVTRHDFSVMCVGRKGHHDFCHACFARPGVQCARPVITREFSRAWSIGYALTFAHDPAPVVWAQAGCNRLVLVRDLPEIWRLAWILRGTRDMSLAQARQLVRKRFAQERTLRKRTGSASDR